MHPRLSGRFRESMAFHRAAQTLEPRLFDIASGLLGALPDDVELPYGSVCVRDDPSLSVSLSEWPTLRWCMGGHGRRRSNNTGGGGHRGSTPPIPTPERRPHQGQDRRRPVACQRSPGSRERDPVVEVVDIEKLTVAHLLSDAVRIRIRAL